LTSPWLGQASPTEANTAKGIGLPGEAGHALRFAIPISRQAFPWCKGQRSWLGLGSGWLRSETPTLSRRFSAVATPLIFAAVIGLSYACDRAYRRWSKENDLFAGLRARLEHERTRYRERRAYVTDVARVIRDVLVEVDRAGSVGSAR
jgi:hypothetical protein